MYDVISIQFRLTKKFPSAWLPGHALQQVRTAFLMASSNSGSNLPRPSKSRLPVSISSIGSHLVTPRDHPTAAAKLSSRLAASLSTPRVPKSPVARPQTLTTNARPSQSYTAQVPPPERPRTKSVPKQPPRFREKNPEQATPSKVPVMSMKEAIALKRAETKKAMAAQRAFSDLRGSSSCVSVEDILPSMVDGDDLGRLSVRETIERARSSGVNQFNGFHITSLTVQGTLPRLAQPCVTRPPVPAFCAIRDPSFDNT